MPNDNSTQKETLSYEAHVLQEILKINELMIRQAHLNEEFHGDDKFSPKNYKISKDENNSSADRFNNEAREIHFQLTSKNISSPKGKNISSSTTVFKIRSRTTLRNAGFERNKLSESVDSSEKEDRTPSSDRTFILTKNDQSLKVDELDILRSTMHENCANSTVRGENQISSSRVRKMEDRSIGDALFSCPFELVEIYSNKNKGKNSENNLNLAFDVSRQTCSMRTFPKEGDKQFKIEKNQLSVSKEETCVDNGKDGGVKDSDKVDEICRKIYTKESDQSNDLQKECRKENCQNRNETVDEECALNNSLINKDFHTKRHAQNNEDSQKERREENDEINEDFPKTQKILKNNISETTVVKLIQDQENSIINSRIANDGTMQINKQNQLDETFISTSKKAEAKQYVNLITIFEATGKPCTEKTREENDFNKSEVTDETRKCNIKQSDDPSTFENNIKLVKLEESCVRNDGLNVAEDTRSLERKKDTNKEKEVVPTIKKQTSELKSANILSIPCTLKRVAKNHDLFVNEKSSKSMKFSDSANDATIKIEEGASEETLRRDVESIPLSQTLCASNAEKSCAKIDNLNASEHTDYSKFHKLTDKVEENVSSTFKQENGQSVKKCLRSNLNAGSRKSNAFGSSSPRQKAEANTSFKFKGGNRSTETKRQKMNSDIDSRRSRVIDQNFFKQYSVNPNERKTSKTMTQHSESDDLKDSSSNLSSSLEDVHRQGKVSNAEKRHANEDLSAENKIKIIIEKRESKEDKVISGNKNLLCNEDIQSSMIKNERIEERDSDDFYGEINVEINDAKHETAMRESRRIGINYKDLNVCKMLTKIHERLTSDWQRMEQLRMKLQISVSVELVNPMMMLQLLDKTIARCKSYIHGSNNSYETELEMAKHLSKYVVELVKIVKINRKSLEDQERRVDQMQSELVQGHHVNKKRTVLNEIIFTSNYWANEIFRLVKNISCLVKHIMAENEEKENIKNLGRCKTQRRIVNDAKQKTGTVRSKTTKSELVKKESTVETQMSVDSNALNTNSLKPSKSTKVLNLSARYAEREKHLDDVADKKTADNCHHSERVKPTKKIMLYTSSNNQSRQAVSRQKHRAPSNQPVWRPGGAAKIPTFNSVTTFVQKTRPATHNREKTNLEDAREEKHGRTVSEFKKKPSTEIYSCKDVPKLNVDNSKIVGKPSDTNLNISPRAKPRSRISRPVSKNFNESEKPFTCLKNYARRSVCDMIHERVTTESKVLRALEEIIRTTSENNEGENVGNAKKTSESIVEVEEEMKVNEEEPTRDIDSERYKKSQLNERSQGDLSENILERGEYSLVSIVPKSLTPVLRAGVGKDTKNVGTSGNFGHIPSEVERNISLETAASCRILDFNATSVETDEIEAWKSSDAVSDQKCKDKEFSENDISKENSSFTDDNEKQQKYDDTEPKTSNNLSIVKIEKARVNSHAISLSMLKEFLYDQGIDVDLVSKAERYLKGKQKARKGLRKKSISFADVSSYVEYDRHFGKRKKEHSWEEELENEIRKDIERNIEKDTEKNIEKSIEKDAGNNMKTNVKRFKVLSKRDISSPRTRDVTTCTIKDSNNACTQTVFHCKTSKGLQTIFKNDSLTTEQTQTEVERRNAYTMTESLRVSDDSVETSKICCSCKSVIPERLDEFQREESKFRTTRQDSGNSRSRGDPREDSRNISITDVEGREGISENESENEDSKLKIRKDPKGSESRKDFHEEVLKCSKGIDKTSSRQCSLVYQKLFHQMQEEHEKSNALLTSVDSSTTHSLSSKSSKDHNLHFNENGTKEEPKDEDRSPVRIVSSGIVAALQVAAIRARNVYRAFDIHKRILRSNLKKLRKQSRQRKKLDKVLGTREEERAKTVSKSDAVLNFKKQVVQRGNDSKKTVVEVFKNLRRAEVAASKEFLGEMLSYSRNESEDNLDFVDTASTNASSSQISFKSIDLEIPRRSSSSVILRNVRSLMEFLVSKADDATFERIERRVEKQSNTREAKFSGNVRMEIVKMNRRFSFFSKENLLLLVYGMLCSVVFWCLNFTITCDVVL